MRVLMVTQAVDLDNPVLGFTHTWINALARRVEKLHVVTLVAGRYHLAGNVVLHAYGPPAASHSRLSRLWFYNKCFAHLVLGSQIDAVFVHMIPRWVILVAPYAEVRRVPIVLWYTHRAVSWQLRLAHRLADRVVTASPESYSLWNEQKVMALGHGIDASHFRPAFRQPDGLFRALSVGRLSPVKQHEVLVEATRILVQEWGMDDLQVRIVGGPARPGDGEYACQLRRIVAAYGLEDCVVFVGPRSYEEVAREYQGSDLFVNLSRTDSLDKAALEAMACEMVVVTSNPAFESLLLDVSEGLLVPHRNAEALAKAVKQVIGMEPEQRRALGLALCERVQRDHGVEQLMERLVSLVEDLARSA